MNAQYIAQLFPKNIKKGLEYTYSLIPSSLRYGKVFWETYKFLEKSQRWSKERLEEYQSLELKRLLYHAYNNVPYYRKLFNNYKLKPAQIKGVEDLKKLPTMNKDIFKQELNNCIAKNIKTKHLPMGRTSGTTGKPLQFYEDYILRQKERAFIYHQWSRVGFKPNMPIVQLKGTIIFGKRPYEYYPEQKVLRLSPGFSEKKTILLYLNKIQKSKAEFIHGYPSIIALFASQIKEYQIPIRFKLKSILFASEKVYPWQRQIVQEVFNCKTFSHYGLGEKVTLAGECEENQMYHCMPQYGITEIDPKTKEIIGTGFLNRINPFIRYHTTDTVNKVRYSACNKCGRNYFPSFSTIEGRLEDYLLTRGGVPISPAIITFLFKKLCSLKSTQIIQVSIDQTIIKAIPYKWSKPTTINNELNKLREGLSKILDSKVSIEIVKEIPLTKVGKFRWVVSKVSKNKLQKGI